MIRSGIAPVDAQLGGFFSGRLHLLTGGPGAGKSTACLQFLDAGLRMGEPVGMVTLDRLSDLAAHARSTGLDLEPPLRAGRLLLLRFRVGFTSLLECAGSPGLVIDDLRRLIAEVRPVRLVVDPLTPFLAESSVSGSALAALAQFLDELGTTAIVTYPRSVSDAADARLDPIVQRAAAILHLTRGSAGRIRLHVVQARAPVAPPILRQLSLPGLGRVTADRASPSTELDGVLADGRPHERVLGNEAST
jgi:circadian clock protein KaiC